MVFLNFLIVIVAIGLTLISTSTLWWMMHAWRSPQLFESIGRPVYGRPSMSFSIIVPCREESEDVMSETVRLLLAQRHPNFEVVISVGDDDLATVANAHRIAEIDSKVKVSINYDPIKNKPRQLNSSLRDCTKEVVGIMDAESLSAPELLARIDSTFQAEDADIVQGAVHLINLRSRWFSLRNCLEYRVWFRSRLHGHADQGFLPLGGNTVFIRRSLLQAVGGWDGDCLAEDCEIGVRLSALGKRTVCVYDTALVTREETPDSTRAFIKQRTRWSLGFMQVLAKGKWKDLPTRGDRLRARWLLMQQYTCALAGIVLPLAIAGAVLSDSPVPVVLLAFLPLIPTLLTVAFEAEILREFGHDLNFRIRSGDYAWLVVSTPFYQLLLAIAALRALWKYRTGDFGWEKTDHVGAHLIPQMQMTTAADGIA
ncbi:UNVERIFIED_CONTAM: cellulose synthase/poly-beta-1,6-N-acetylglucosamine synthase-like glycosyltransferase [Williamsia faeni]